MSLFSALGGIAAAVSSLFGYEPVWVLPAWHSRGEQLAR